MNISTFYFLIFSSQILSQELSQARQDELKQLFEYYYSKSNTLLRGLGDLSNSKNQREKMFFQTANELERLNDQLGQKALILNEYALLNSEERQRFNGLDTEKAITNQQSSQIDNQDSLPTLQLLAQDIQQTNLVQPPTLMQQYDFVDLQSDQELGIVIPNLSKYCSDLSYNEYSWFETWKQTFSKIDNLLLQNYQKSINYCDNLVAQYGTTQYAKETCNRFFYTNALNNYQLHVQYYIANMDQSQKQKQNTYGFSKINVCYVELKNLIQLERKKVQRNITSQFENYVQKYNFNNNSVNPQILTPRTIREAVLNKTIEQSVDWVAKGMVTSVKNQGNCGSCWAFSTVAMLESANLMKYREKIDLSEQQLLDCAPGSGCNGGLMSQAIRYVKNYGTTYENVISYLFRQYQCRNDIQRPFRIKNYESLQSGNILEFLKVLSKRPVTLAIHAGQYLPFAKNYIIKENDAICPRYKEPDHAVLAVGYYIDLQDDNQMYVKIKNSYGENAGDGGYFRLQILNEIPSSTSPQRFGTCNMLKLFKEIIWAEVQ